MLPVTVFLCLTPLLTLAANNSHQLSAKDNGCVTTQNVPCVFPFTYDGLWFPACVNVRKMLPMDQYWCSTKTNADGTHVEGQWGLCGEQCPKVLYENGWCLDEDGKDQNNGVIFDHSGIINMFRFVQLSCWLACVEKWKAGIATGCEFYRDGLYMKCHYHTKTVTKGNGNGQYRCWVFPPRDILENLFDLPQMTKMTNALTEAVNKNVTMTTALAMEGAKDKEPEAEIDDQNNGKKVEMNFFLLQCLIYLQIFGR